MSKAKIKVVLAMSGGVDSSVAAHLLLREGYDVMGVFMRLGTPAGVEALEETCDLPSSPSPHSSLIAHQSSDPSLLAHQSSDNHHPLPITHHPQKQGCCSVLDAADARRVAGLLGIPFYVLNFQDDFSKVIDYFTAEYNAGRTPNPCVRCNDWLKFGKLARYAEAVGAEYVASGHYARIGIDPASGQKALLRGLDHRKDQSYVLFGMDRKTLDHTLLPIGDLEKHEVRAIAEEQNLPVFNKPDSQEICFVPNQDYAGLVRRRTPEAFGEGELVDGQGKTVGRHDGHQHFTIGQRKGVGVAFGRPIYVVGIDASTNRVTLGDKEELLRNGLIAGQINLLSGRVRQGQPLPCTAKIRYNHAPQPAVLTWDGVDQLKVHFDTPQPAITPGQAVVCYDGDVVLGGGWIDAAE